MAVSDFHDPSPLNIVSLCYQKQNGSVAGNKYLFTGSKWLDLTVQNILCSYSDTWISGHNDDKWIIQLFNTGTDILNLSLTKTGISFSSQFQVFRFLHNSQNISVYLVT